MRRTLTLGRREFLLGAAASGLVGLRPARASATAKNLIVVVANGGWDPTFVFDARPGLGDGPFVDQDPELAGDVEEPVSYGELTLSTNPRKRPAVTAFFDRWSPRTAVVNGLWTGTLSHWDAMLRVLTGTSDPSAADLVARFGASHPELPLPAIDAAGVGRPGPHGATTGRTGVRGQLSALVTPGVRYPLPEGPRPDPELDAADREAIDAYLAAGGASEGRLSSRERAAELRSRATELGSVLPGGRRRGLAADLELAVELCGAGFCQSILVDSAESWDSHANAARQHGSWNRLFAALSEAATALEARGMLDDTLVVVVSELGRTPWRNQQQGTDHWPYTSAVLFGADVRGGTLLGGTDDGFVGRTCDPSTGRPDASAADPLLITNLTAGVLEAVGIEDPVPGVVPLRGFRA